MSQSIALVDVEVLEFSSGDIYLLTSLGALYTCPSPSIYLKLSISRSHSLAGRHPLPRERPRLIVFDRSHSPSMRSVHA